MSNKRFRRRRRRVAVVALTASGLASASLFPVTGAETPTDSILVLPEAVKPWSVHRGPVASSEEPVGMDSLLCSGPIPTDAATVNLHVEEDIISRKNIKFNADPTYVQSLYAHPDQTTGCLTQGILFTKAEAANVALNMRLSEVTTRVHNYLLASKYRSEFAGVIIDNANGRVKVMMTTGVPATDLVTTLADIVGGSQYLEFGLARYNIDQLYALSDYIATRYQSSIDVSNTAFGSGAPRVATPSIFPEPAVESEIVGTSVDFADNRVAITIDEPRYSTGVIPSAVEQALEYYHLDDSAISMKVGPATKAANGVGGVKSWLLDNVNGTYPGHRGMSCTNGFTLFDWSEPSSRYMLTAGHCWHYENSDTGISHWSGLPNKVVEPTGDNALIGMGDAYQIVQSSDFGVWRAVSDLASNKVCSPASGNCAPVKMWQTGVATGTYVYRAGASSNNVVLAEVLSNDASAGGFTHLLKLSASVTGGDSGGPVYRFPNGQNYVSAIGTNELCTLDSSGHCDPGAPSYAVSMGQFNSFSNWVDSATGSAIGHLQPYLGE